VGLGGRRGVEVSLLAFDLESHLIQPGLLAPPIVCGSFADKRTGIRLLMSREETLDEVEASLSGDDVIFVGANIAYDWGCILAVRPDLLPLIWKAYAEERVFDVLIAGTLDAIAGGRLRSEDGPTELFMRNGKKIQSGRYSLESVTEDYLGRTDAKRNDRWRKSYALLADIPISEWPEDARQYPIDDAVNTLEVAEVQLKQCQNLHNLPAQAHAAFCAHLGAIWGLRVDPERVNALKASVDENMARVQKFAVEHKLLKLGGTKKAPKWTKDTKYIKELVYKAYDGLPPTTDGGDISMSREALQDSMDPVLVEFSETSKWEKLHTYANTLFEAKDNPFNVECNILLSTGRASYKGLIQLIPRKGGVRECFTARPGYVWSSVDYAAIEMSTLAQVCLWALGYSKLADAINADVDPHSLFAAEMTGAQYEDFLKNKERAEEKGYRQAAKAANFGFPGMMGGVSFVTAKKTEGEKVCEWTYRDGQCGSEKVRQWKGRDLDSPFCKRCIEEAEKLRQFYLRQWPEMPNYFKWVQAEGDTVEQFVSKRVRGGCSGPAAANTRFQGLAADGAKAAIVKMTEEMYLDSSSPLYGSRLMVFAHDESILEIPEEKAHEAAHRQAEIMVSEMRRFVPDVKVKAEPALMRHWSKSVTTKYDANGRLIPWEQA
jgi:DNA polymerase I-like protein with 3'-5' exonuclease and polymerase domains